MFRLNPSGLHHDHASPVFMWYACLSVPACLDVFLCLRDSLTHIIYIYKAFWKGVPVLNTLLKGLVCLLVSALPF